MEEDNEPIYIFALGEVEEGQITENYFAQDSLGTQEIVCEITVQSNIEDMPIKPEEKTPIARAKPKKRFACQQCPRKYSKNMALTKHINSIHLKLKVV